MRNSWKRTPTLTLVFLLGAAAFSQRPGDLVVTPTRVQLDDKGRSSDITLVNRGSQTVRYRLTLVDMEMSEDGVLRRAQNPNNSALSILRLSPREISLEPGVSQRIKIAAFFPKGASDGELRSHLAFEPIAIPRLAAQQSEDSSPAFKLNFELRSVVTIPVIARHGRLTAEASVSDIVLSQDEKGSSVRFKLARTGSRSVRGDVTIDFIPAGGGSKIRLGQIVALPVYFPNADRIVSVRLNRDVRSLRKGEIEVSFGEPERSRGAAMARAVIELAK